MKGTITHTLQWVDDEDGFEVELEVYYVVSGKYQPATWGDSGGCPEEWPEFEVIDVYLEDGSKVPWPWLFGGHGWEPPWKLDLAKLEEECAEKHEPPERDYS